MRTPLKEKEVNCKHCGERCKVKAKAGGGWREYCQTCVKNKVWMRNFKI